LNQVREEWATLIKARAADGNSRVANDNLAALVRRFEEAATLCEKRHDAWVVRHERVRQLDVLTTEIEQLVATGDHETVRAGWSQLEKTWCSLMATVQSGSPSGDAENGVTVANLQQRKEAATKRHRALGNAAEMARERKAQTNLTRLQRFSDSIDAAVVKDDLGLAGVPDGKYGTPFAHPTPRSMRRQDA